MSIFLCLSNIPLYIYHIIFIYTSVNMHLGCFHLLAVINTAAMNICKLVSLQMRVFIFSGFLLRSGITGSHANFFFSGQLSAPGGTEPGPRQWKHSILTSATEELPALVFQELHTALHSGCTTHVPQQCRRPLFSTPSPAFAVCGLLVMAILTSGS